jgi:hypothetical protein
LPNPGEATADIFDERGHKGRLRDVLMSVHFRRLFLEIFNRSRYSSAESKTR